MTKFNISLKLLLQFLSHQDTISNLFFFLFAHIADENCVSLWSFYVTSEKNNTYDENNDVTRKSHLQNVTGDEKIVLP